MWRVNTLDIFQSIHEGERLKQEAITQVDENADAAWKAECYRVIEWMAKSKQFFSADEVWEHLTGGTHEPRAMGAIFIQAKKDGLIKPTSEWRPSVRPSQHRQPVRVWRSLDESTQMPNIGSRRLGYIGSYCGSPQFVRWHGGRRGGIVPKCSCYLSSVWLYHLLQCNANGHYSFIRKIRCQVLNFTNHKRSNPLFPSLALEQDFTPMEWREE